MAGPYLPQKPPWFRQQEALDASKDRLAFAYLMAMRTGKTKVTLDDFGRRECAGEIDDFLLIAPAGVYRTWENAIQEHVSVDLQARLQVFTWSAQLGKGEEKVLAQFLADQTKPRVLLVNVEALSSVPRARELCIEFASQRRCYCAVDESTSVKNPKAKRTKFLLARIRPLVAVRRILCGLIAPRDPLDIWAQFAFLGEELLGFSSYRTFRAHYAKMKPMLLKGRWVQVVDSFQNLDDLQERVAKHSYRCTLEDCYDVPAKTYMKREVTLTPEQERVYREIRDFATAKLAAEAYVTATIVIVQLVRMHQVLCGHVVDELGNEHELPENRTKALLGLLEEHAGKAVIWCSYDLDIRKVSAALTKAYGAGSVARFWGGNLQTREDEEKQFLSDPKCLFMVATAAAGGRGRTWVNADLVVYFSNTNNLEHRSQSEERAQGVDKTRPVAYVDLVVPNTLDEKIITALRAKINMAATINGDNYREWLV